MSEEGSHPPSKREIVPYGDYCLGQYGIFREDMRIPEAVKALDEYFERRGLTVVIRRHWDRFIRADIFQGEALVDMIIMDRKTGRIRSVY